MPVGLRIPEVLRRVLGESESSSESLAPARRVIGELGSTAEFPRSSTLQDRRCTMKYTIHRTNGTSIMVFIVPSTRTKRPLRRENTSNRSTAELSFPRCSPKERFLRYNTLSGTKCGPYPVSLSWLSNCPCSCTDSVTYSMSRLELVSNFHTISFVVNSTVARQVQQSLSRLSMFFRRHNHQLLVRDLL